MRNIVAAPLHAARISTKVGDLRTKLIAPAAAATIAFFIYRINAAWSDEPETAVAVVGAMFAFLLALPPAVYLLARRREAGLADLGLVLIGSVGVLLAACYLFRIGFEVMFPGDFLIWSESDFVNDILKFRQNYPIFTADVNNESFTYVPGSQLLTYFLAWLAGFPTSVPAYRAIQVFYTILSAAVAFLCCRRLVNLAFGAEAKIGNSAWWNVVWLTGLFLIAGNSLTNGFTHLLHNDSLAQLVTVTAYWLLLEYEATKDKRILWLMILVPAVGFWVKQSLIIWAVLYSAYLLIFDRPRSFKKIFGFALASFGAVAISILIGYWLWQKDFIYWVFTVLGAHGVSPLRSFRHLLNVWAYFAVGLIGGAILLHGAGFKKLFGAWTIWLALISIQTYTSGVAWMMNHIGAGCLIAGIWFFAALAVVWQRIADAPIKTAVAGDWLRAGAAVAVVCLIFSGFGVIRVPVSPFGEDAARYVREIENEFAAEPPERTLLDFGTWVYLPSGVVMKDRVPTVGERGWSQTGDFSGILNRLEQKYYRKILVRNLHAPDFWYDYESWRRSSRIKKTLLENYREVGAIKPVAGLKPEEMPYGFKEISILVPREN
jgi:hypothetical protein